MPAASIRRHAPGGSAHPDARTPPQASHLALVAGTVSVEDRARSTLGPQDAFCARLRAARERRGIPLAAIARTTKVSASLFESFERGDLRRWPKGIYRRAFFRSYVETIGLPAESTVDEFLLLFPDEKLPAPLFPEDKPAVPQPTTPPPEPASPAISLRLTLAPELARVSLRERVSFQAAIDALTVLVLALSLAWWSGLGAAPTAALVALCYYPQLSRAARQQIAAWRAPRASRARDERPAAHQASAGEQPAPVPASAT